MNQPPVRPDHKAAIESVEAQLLGAPQVDMPVTHHFSKGVYVRELSVPAGTFLIGHEHKEECLNILLSGRARVFDGDKVVELSAPFVFKSGAGVRKMALVLENMRWLNIHPTDKTNLEEIEADTIVKSESFLKHEQLKKLTEGGA